MDIVELGPMGSERRGGDGSKDFKFSVLGRREPRPLTRTRTVSFLTFGKHYVRVPVATKAVPVHKFVPKKMISLWPRFLFPGTLAYT
jgi:hypothetical protein